MTTVDVSTSTPARKIQHPIIDGFRVCNRCQQNKPIDEYYLDKRRNEYFGYCNICRLEKCRSNKKIYKQKKIESDHAAWKRYCYEEQVKIAKRKAEIAGKDYRPWGHGEALQDKLIEKAYDRLAEQNARDAFKWWFAKKTDEQVAAWYEATGKPWLNPRLGLSNARQAMFRLKIDKHFNTKCKIGSQVRNYMKKYHNGSVGFRYVKRLCGIDIPELSRHLERQFTKGMTWDKFFQGEISIDHIIPVSSFDFSKDEDIKACWSLPNLRPMWLKENIQKSNKILTLL